MIDVYRKQRFKVRKMDMLFKIIIKHITRIMYFPLIILLNIRKKLRTSSITIRIM